MVVLAALLNVAAGAAPVSLPVELGGFARLRYELSDADSAPEPSDALTLAVRSFAVYEPSRSWSFLAEVEAVGVLAGEFDDGEGLPDGTVPIPDPAAFNLNRLYVSYRPDDQTFDGGRAVVTLPSGLSVDFSIVDAVQRPAGLRRTPQHLGGSATFLKTEVPTRAGLLHGFRYDLQFGENGVPSALPAGRSVTYGAGLDGRWGGAPWALRWSFALAQQATDDDRPGLSGTAPYGKAELAVERQRTDVIWRYERLAGGNAPFRTPLATLHRFQGFADVFLVTPNQGVEDNSLEIRHRLGRVGPMRRVGGFVRVHDFNATEGSGDLGHEIDVGVAGSFRGVRFSLQRAQYWSDGFASDTERWFLTAGRSF
ncbi:MAG: hypothetical protein HRU11_01620 [Parvularculaceae bacterium]|nr:hypothetical protein [Parvularculaceae bacterium]